MQRRFSAPAEWRGLACFRLRHVTDAQTLGVLVYYLVLGGDVPAFWTFPCQWASPTLRPDWHPKRHDQPRAGKPTSGSAVNIGGADTGG